MTSPSDPRSDEPEEPVSLSKEPSENDAPFDPYRFGLPETPPPPEYAPPGWTPPAGGPWSATPQGPTWAAPSSPQPPYAGGPGHPPYGGGPGHPYGPGQPPYPGGPRQPHYPPYPYGSSPYKTRAGSNGKAVAALVFGILTILMFWLSVLDAALAIPAIVFGILGLNEANRSGGNGKGLAIAGLVCGAVGAVLAIVFTAFLVHAVNQCGGLNRSNLPGFQQCLQNHFTGSPQ